MATVHSELSPDNVGHFDQVSIASTSSYITASAEMIPIHCIRQQQQWEIAFGSYNQLLMGYI